MLGALGLTVAALVVFFLFSIRFVERETLQANETVLALIIEGIEKGTREIRTFAYTIGYNYSVQRSLFEPDVPRMAELARDFYQIAEMTKNTNEFIDDVALFTGDLGVFRNISANLTYSEYKEGLLGFLDRTPRTAGLFTAVDGETGELYFCWVLPLHAFGPTMDTSREIGYCLTSFSTARIGTYFLRVSALRHGIVAVVDGSGRLVAHAGPDPRTVPDVSALASQPRRYLVSSRVIPEIGYTLYSFVPRRDVTARQRGYLLLSLLLVGILLATTILIAMRFGQGFSAPLDRLLGQLAAIDGSDPALRIHDIPANELGTIGSSVNRMLDKIHEMTERGLEDQRTIHDMELATKEAELLALQAQINPHFLYNTLECVRSLGMDYGSPEIVRVSTALADILRYCLRGDREVALAEEIRIVEEYVEILRLRYGDRYAFRVEAQEEIRSATVVKMILQPIVENAVFHGLENRRRGNLSVQCRRQGERLLFTVRDDGRGIPTEALADLRTAFLSLGDRPSSLDLPTGRDRRSLGLLNIHRRVRARYGPEFGLAIESRLEEGTTVTVRLPYRSGNPAGTQGGCLPPARA